MLIEFLPEKKSVGLLNGHFCSPESVAELTAGEQAAVVQVNHLDRWQKLTLELGNEPVGHAKLNLRIKGV